MTKKLYCFKHKKEGMVNVREPTCKENTCDTLPSFNVSGSPNALFCSVHKKEGMVNIKYKKKYNKRCKKKYNKTCYSDIVNKDEEMAELLYFMANGLSKKY